jgi:DoxX-like family
MVARTGIARNSVSTTSWTSWIVSGLLIAFMISDAIPKVLNMSFASSGTVDLGYPDSVVVPIGMALLVSTILYTLPRTAFIGAILLTGYLGGAIAPQVRLEDWWFLFPAAMAVLVWVGLAMRNPRVARMLGI